MSDDDGVEEWLQKSLWHYW